VIPSLGIFEVSTKFECSSVSAVMHEFAIMKVGDWVAQNATVYIPCSRSKLEL
jgi:hypothetical protein